MTPEPDLEQLRRELSAVEQRVAALEAATAVPPAAAERAPAYDPEVFWALEGLRARVGAASGGAVQLTGTVRLPTGEEADWQQAAMTEALLEGDWSLHAEALAALGHPVRLRLLRAVLTGARTTAELADLDEVGTTGQLYHHLRPLTGAGWLRSSGRGRYEVPAERLVPLLVVLAATAP